jgi:hypothetical protein
LKNRQRYRRSRVVPAARPANGVTLLRPQKRRHRIVKIAIAYARNRALTFWFVRKLPNVRNAVVPPGWEAVQIHGYPEGEESPGRSFRKGLRPGSLRYGNGRLPTSANWQLAVEMCV